MQSTLCAKSRHLNFHFHSQPNTTQLTSQQTFSRKFVKFRTSANSLSTPPLHHEHEEDSGEIHVSISPRKLPVVIRRSGKVSRFIWDGSGLQLETVGGGGGAAPFSVDLSREVRRVVRDFFLPKHVSENYIEYVKWKFLHRVFSSALQVLATQAMFRAIGIGYSRSLPSAAALNWVLKDGLGRLSRCIYTASFASAFDTNLKRVRFSTSVLFSLSIGVELLTPAFPQYFLLIATLANVAKQISLACYLATGTAVHRSFAIADNLGEVSAKCQIQTVCFDNIGLMLAALFNMLLKNNQRMQAIFPFLVYPAFTAMDLLGIYQGLKHVHLHTLTKDRLEIILNTWIDSCYVPSPAEVSKVEGIDIFNNKAKEIWPIRIGCLSAKIEKPELSMMAMRSITDEDYYFICLDTLHSKLTKTMEHILLCPREGATTTDIITGLLQACYMRKALLQNKSFWKQRFETRGGGDSRSAMKDWFKLVEESKVFAEESRNTVSELISSVGWAVKSILLSTEEQVRYDFVDH